MQERSTHQDGFTVLEVLVVGILLVILGLIALFMMGALH